MIIPKYQVICYNISLYQTLFVGIQQKGVDFMGKDLKGKELGVGICQRKDGLYTARFISKRTGKSVQRYFPKLQECRKWYADAKFEDEHGGINASGDMTVTAWFDYRIENIKGDSIRPNTIRNYKERFEHNIKKCIGNMVLSEVKPMHCQNVLNQMKDDYKSSTIYQTRITLYCMFSDAVAILKRQKEKLREIKVINMQFKENVFLCRKGEPTKNSAYDTSLFKLCDKAGIRRFSMHVLRHTMATRCIEGGMRPKTLQVILGHANVGITMNLYVDVTEEEKFKEVEKIESALKIV